MERVEIGSLRWADSGLLPAIAQKHDSNEVLMQVWMNADALRESLETGQAVYCMNSSDADDRQFEHRLLEARTDCDCDCLLLRVDQTGPAGNGFVDKQTRWDGVGLLPAIAQQHDTGEVLMQAWMDQSTLQETLDTERVVYHSRRRGRWRKGATSGHTQRLVEARYSGDECVLLLVDQTGPACHTGARSCFFRSVAVESDS